MLTNEHLELLNNRINIYEELKKQYIGDDLKVFELEIRINEIKDAIKLLELGVNLYE